MQPTELTYAIFEANQVLTSDHLNDDFNYLDEQERLTRANLSGIGIVCGLEVSAVGDASHQTITISRGCGVTSEGYLIILGDAGFTADRCREYTAPAELPYPLFTEKSGQGKGEQYSLYELLDKDRDEYADGLQITQNLISNPVVLLFLELDKGNLKNCSPVSCDDKGLRVNVTVRKLLIAADDLKKMNDEIAARLEADGKRGDFFPDLEQRLRLPDLALQRLDVPTPVMKDSQSIFLAYRKLLTPALFKNMQSAFTKAWTVFQPILAELAPTDPFAGLVMSLGDRYLKLASDRRVIFSQYYYDLVDDLLQAYEEFRWKGVELMALCCPPAGLYPRHLILGEMTPDADTARSKFRNYFRPSPAVTDQARLRKEVLSLFNRLLLMVRAFDESAAPSAHLPVSDNVRITPSRIGAQPLSQRAIPYYYNVTSGSPALYERWDYRKTSTGRSRQNLSYNAPSYAREDIALNPLVYDLQAYNFFRIEGHIGLSWRSVLDDLLKKVQKYRLPFDVVVLNASNATVRSNPWLNRCISNDLQVIYNSWVKEAECMYRTKMNFFTGLKINALFAANNTVRPGAAPRVTAETASFQTARVATGAVVSRISVVDSVVKDPGTLGNLFLNVLVQPSVKTGQDIRVNVTKNLRDIAEVNNMAGKDYDLVFGNRLDLVAAVYDYTSALPDDAATMDEVTIDDKYTALVNAVKKYRDQVGAYAPPAQNPLLTQAEKDEILRQLNSLVDNCLQERLKSLQAEIVSRRQQMEEMIYFSRYAANHPELQHKAGVPVGGTFVLVFQEPTPAPAPVNPPPVVGPLTDVASPSVIAQPAVTVNQQILAEAFSRIGTNLTADILKRISAVVPGVAVFQPLFQIPDGVVIADFFVPSRCCSDCPPIQFTLPAAKDVEVVLKGSEGPIPNVIVKPQSGVGPYLFSVDGGEFKQLPETREIRLESGPHTLVIRDSAGIESPTRDLTIPLPLAIGPATFTPNRQATFKISGGTPPYSADSGTIAADGSFTSETIPVDQSLVVKITDSIGCAVFSAKLKP